MTQKSTLVIDDKLRKSWGEPAGGILFSNRIEYLDYIVSSTT